MHQGIDFTCSTWQSTGSSISLKARSYSFMIILIIFVITEIAFICETNILEMSLFLREHPHIKVSILVGLKGGGDDEVFSRGQTEAVAHFAQVGEVPGACSRTVVQEKVFLQVHLPFARVLENETRAVWSHEGTVYLPSDCLLFFKIFYNV